MGDYDSIGIDFNDFALKFALLSVLRETHF